MARTSLKLSGRRENASGDAVSFHGVITVAACRAVLWRKKAQIGKERCACPSKTLRATQEVRNQNSELRTQESGVQNETPAFQF